MEIKSYNNFWQRIHKSAKENGFPLRVMWELTYRCNFKCRHCYVPKSYKKKSRQELNTQEVFYILDQLADLGCFYLGFTGGEPFLREDIFDILWYAKKKGFQIIIYTNGSLIDKAKAEELKQLNPNKVDITIPAISKKAFEHITGVKRCRDKVFKAIGLLHKNGIKLGFKSCLLKVNENEIKEIQDFAASLGALHRLDNRLSPRLDGDREPYRYRGGLNEKSVAGNTYQVTRSRSCEIGQDYEKTKHEPRHACRQAGTTNHEPLFKCGVGVSQAAINPFGELKMCLMIDYPKYKILNKQVSGIRYQVSGNTSHVSGSTYQVAGNTSHVSGSTYQVAGNTSHVTRRTSHVARQEDGLKCAWERLKELVAAIKPDKNYQCGKCILYSYCKWCPGKTWLYNKTFTSCEPESKNWAMQRKLGYEDRG